MARVNVGNPVKNCLSLGAGLPPARPVNLGTPNGGNQLDDALGRIGIA